MAAADAAAVEVDTTLNPRVAALKPSKTMALTDLATRLREEGKDVIGLAAGEPDVSCSRLKAERAPRMHLKACQAMQTAQHVARCWQRSAAVQRVDMQAV